MTAEFLVDVMTPFARAEHARCYIAYIDDEAAGAATMFARSDLRVAGFFGAATLARFRKRGVQTALLRRRMADALAAGCEIGIVTTQPGSASHRNVARRGFDLLYTKITTSLDMPRSNA
jgi:GNAT superfamily N-acetyltransferase